MEGLGEQIQEAGRRGTSTFLVVLMEAGPKVRPGGIENVFRGRRLEGSM